MAMDTTFNWSMSLYCRCESWAIAANYVKTSSLYAVARDTLLAVDAAVMVPNLDNDSRNSVFHRFRLNFFVLSSIGFTCVALRG